MTGVARRPFSLNVSELNALLDELPSMAGQSRQLEDLSGGLTNRNVKVTTPNGVYVARFMDTTSTLLGIDREHEYYNSKAAEQAGVGAPVIDYRSDLGILLIGYLNGKTLCNEDFQRPGVVAKVVLQHVGHCILDRGSADASTCSNANLTT